jgi:cytochrome P450
MSSRIADKSDVYHGVRIPKGTGIFFSAGLSNFDRRTWGEDAEVFNPDRWDSLPETMSNFSFMTFLQGDPLLN